MLLAFCSFPPHHRHAGFPLNHSKARRCLNVISACVTDPLQVSIQRGIVKDFGRIVKLQQDGSFPQPEQLHTPIHWRPVLEFLTQNILERLKELSLIAICLRGSGASGYYFKDKRSDMDLIVLTRKNVTSSLQSRLRQELSLIVRSQLGLSGIDIKYFTVQEDSDEYVVAPWLRILLMHYSIEIYGSLPKSWTDFQLFPVTHLAIDIKAAQRQTNEIICSQTSEGIKVTAIQWFIKMCLRATAELATSITKCHCRDLVPCYRMSAKAYPQYRDVFLNGLQIACACEENNLAGHSYSSLLQDGLAVSGYLTEIVEDIFLKQTFGRGFNDLIQSQSMSIDSIMPSQPRLSRLRQTITEIVTRLQFPIRSNKVHNSRSQFLRSTLPSISIQPSRPVSEVKVFDRYSEREKNKESLCNHYKPNHPVVIRNATFAFNKEQSLHDLNSFLLDLHRNHRVVSCRISPSNEVTFCRSSHAWIESGSFSPPSVVREVSVSEALERMSEKHILHPLHFTRARQETVYIQTEAKLVERLLQMMPINELQVAQHERIWVSTPGTVSTLHYDASYSALFQRCGRKRMIFFSPSALSHMGIYPLGHPLHRRARVSLGQRDTKVFKDFWEECESEAIEVVLYPGDVVFFPPKWAHYTESISEGSEALSVSHTFRYF